jgi:hypothetical protein
MAVNKTISANGSKNHHKFTLTVNEDSTSGNSSYLSYSFKLSPVSNGWNWYGFGSDVKYTVTINGVNYTGSIDTYDGRSTVTLKSGSNIEVAHNSDGTKTINISFNVTDTSGSPYPPGNASASDTLTLTALHKSPTASITSITERNSSLSGVANNVIANYLSIKRFVLSYQVYDDATISTDGVAVFEQGLSQLPATVTVGTSTITVDVDFRNTSLLTSSLESGKTKILFFIVDSKNGRYPLNTPEYNIIPYQKPNLIQTSSHVKRNGQTTGKGKLNLTGTFYNANVGNTTNTISLSYKYWRSDTTEPSDSSYISIPSSANVGTGNNITISGWGLKNGNTEITNLNQNYAYKFKIKGVDTFNNPHTIELVLSKGLWIMAKFKDRVDFLKITIGGKEVVPNVGIGDYVKLTLSNRYTAEPSAWTQTKTNFSNSYFTTNNQEAYTKDTYGIICNFDGIVMVSKTISTGASGEMDIATDNGGGIEVLNTEGHNTYHTYIKEVTSGDLIDLVFNTNNTSFSIYEGTQISIVRIK